MNYPVPKLVPSGPMYRWCVYEKVFSEEEVDRIKFFKKILNFDQAKIVSDNPENTNVRNCLSATIPVDDNTSFIYEKIANTVGGANYDFFLYDITSMEMLQYLLYESPDGHYCVHRDALHAGYRPEDRKISFILMLSDPEEYEGGEIYLDRNLGPEEMKINTLNKGDMIFFDSNKPHEVTPVTSGQREVIVSWVWGPTQL